MTSYLIRRCLLACLTLGLITFVIYGLIRSMPGDPVAVIAGNEDPSKKIKPEDLERMRAAYGLDKPWYIAYGTWMGNVFQGDLGRSISRKQPVTRLIAERIGPTLLLSITSLILTYGMSIPLGLYMSVRSGKTDERISGVTLFALYSFPAFVAALFMQIQFAVTHDWLPLFGMVSDNHDQLSFAGKAWDIATHMVMPVTCSTYVSLAYYSRFIRATMQETLRQDYIRTARAKGVDPARLVVVHAFRNTLIPLVTLIGLTLPSLLGGSVILEQIFTWPGMGRLFFEAISERDYPTIMGLTLMFSVLTLASQLLADVLYAFVDPRISYQ
jgi:peptide/nickel transport system permease protein